MPTPLELEKGSIAAKLLSLRGKWGWFPEEKFDSVTGRWAHARGAVKSGIYALGLFSLRPSDLCKVFQRWKGILWNYSGHARNHHMLGTSSWASPGVPCGAPVTLWVSRPLCARCALSEDQCNNIGGFWGPQFCFASVMLKMPTFLWWQFVRRSLNSMFWLHTF